MSITLESLPSIAFSPDELLVLGTGSYTSTQLAKLCLGQRSKRNLQIAASISLAGSRSVNPIDRSRLNELVTMFEKLDRTAPQALERAIMYPLTGPRIALMLSTLLESDDGDSFLASIDTFARIVLSAAIFAEETFEADIPVGVGNVVLFPELGGALFLNADEGSYVHASVSAGACVVTTSSGSVLLEFDQTLISVIVSNKAEWRLFSRLVAEADGISSSLEVNDVDPFGLYGYANGFPLQILSDETVNEWQEIYQSTWRFLVHHHRSQAIAMSTVLHLVVPQVLPAGFKPTTSATVSESFGSLITAKPVDAASCGETLIHEFHHAKLSAIMDIQQLCSEDSRRLYYAPWREDARPLNGLLQGAYAFMGIATYWNVVRKFSVNETARSRGEYQVAVLRDQVAIALEQVISDERSLSSDGQHFVNGMAKQLAVLQDEKISSHVMQEAKRLNETVFATWKQRNHRVI